MLGAIGDLVEDIVVYLGGPVALASDTEAHVVRRRGGSAANVAAVAASLTGAARFIGQVGDDRAGAGLVAELTAAGVQVVGRRGGRSGTIVVLVDHLGERTMLSDRGASMLLDAADAAWLDGLHTLHVPAYSLAVEPIASTALALAALAGERGLRVSVDAASVAVIEAFGVDALVERVAALHPAVLLANADEARCLGEEGMARIAAALTVVKHGAGPASVVGAGKDAVEVPAVALTAVEDSTGAGDAFAAGLLCALAEGAEPVEAARRAHQVAAAVLSAPRR